MASIAFTAELVTDTCITCGCEFAMPQALQLQRRRDHAWFYCPNGHAQQYSGKSEAEKLRDQLVAMQAQRDRERATVQRLSDESAASYEEHRSVADLVASGGIVDAP